MDRVNRTIDELKLGVTIEPREIAPNARDVVPASITCSSRRMRATRNPGGRGLRASATNRRRRRLRDSPQRPDASNYLVPPWRPRRQFNKLLPYYEREGELFKQRLLAETIQRVLPIPVQNLPAGPRRWQTVGIAITVKQRTGNTEKRNVETGVSRMQVTSC